MYGIGTGLPVLAFSVLIIGGFEYFGKVYDRINQIGNFVKNATGLVFILVGIYYIFKYMFGLL